MVTQNARIILFFSERHILLFILARCLSEMVKMFDSGVATALTCQPLSLWEAKKVETTATTTTKTSVTC